MARSYKYFDMRSIPAGRRTGMCSVNQTPTRGFSVRRFIASGLVSVALEPSQDIVNLGNEM